MEGGRCKECASNGLIKRNKVEASDFKWQKGQVNGGKVIPKDGQTGNPWSRLACPLLWSAGEGLEKSTSQNLYILQWVELRGLSLPLRHVCVLTVSRFNRAACHYLSPTCAVNFGVARFQSGDGFSGWSIFLCRKFVGRCRLNLSHIAVNVE